MTRQVDIYSVRGNGTRGKHLGTGTLNDDKQDKCIKLKAGCVLSIGWKIFVEGAVYAVENVFPTKFGKSTTYHLVREN